MGSKCCLAMRQAWVLCHEITIARRGNKSQTRRGETVSADTRDQDDGAQYARVSVPADDLSYYITTYLPSTNTAGRLWLLPKSINIEAMLDCANSLIESRWMEAVLTLASCDLADPITPRKCMSKSGQPSVSRVNHHSGPYHSTHGYSYVQRHSKTPFVIILVTKGSRTFRVKNVAWWNWSTKTS